MKNKKLKILVTGGAGFIGSHIVDKYISEGHSVVVVDNLSTGKKENINPEAKFYTVDITDIKHLSQIFENEKPDVVNHHAAQIDVRKSVADPTFDANVNIIGSINLLENCKKYNVKKFIFASSGGTIYGECSYIPPDEDSQYFPMSPYGIAKLSVEYYIKYYSETFNIKTAILRYGNVYGPRQDPHGEAGVVAIFSERMLKNEPVFIFGDGKQMRDYVYVEDVVRANLLVLNHDENLTLNIGTSKPTSVLELFEMMKKICGYKQNPVFKPPRTGELFKSFLDIKKAKEKIGWEPLFNLEEGLKKTIEYFRNMM
ncbi:MAG: NAD-dependent epimerase/dehydratase family protein [Endomicrobiia bacterium]